MKKSCKLFLIITLLVLALFNVLMFAIPMNKDTAFWVFYIFTSVAIVATGGISIFTITVAKDKDATVFSFPIIKWSLVYLAAQVVVGVSLFTVSRILKGFPVWVPIVFSVVIIIAFAIILCLNFFVWEKVKDDIKEQARDLAFSKNMYAELYRLSAMLEGNSQQEVKNFADEVRFSDSVTCAAAAGVEEQMIEKLAELEASVVENNEEEISLSIKQLRIMLSKRQTIIKLNKR